MREKWLKGVLCFLLGLLGCGEGVGTSTGNPTTPKEQAFPSNLAVASPFETVTVTEGTSPLRTVLFQSVPFVSGFENAADSIARILDGEEASECHFDAALFFKREINASCYGPNVSYENHPDGLGTPQEDGELPGGDVGIWTQIDSETDHACAAAQLNARMGSLKERSLGALMGLASLICAAEVNGLDLPENSTLDLTEEMNGLGIPNVSFKEATLTHSNASGEEEWNYQIFLVLDTDSDSSTDAIVELIHRPDSSFDNPESSGEGYSGRLSYRINDTIDPPGQCPEKEQTFNGSLVYQKEGSNDLKVQARSAHFCGHDSDGQTNGVVDPSKKFDPESSPTGWANSFNLFTASFDPDTLVGNYGFAWQAGQGDRYTRVLNTSLSEGEGGGLDGSAFYGFGDDVATTDGGITGFFCNWAGPNGSSSTGANLKKLAQFQELRLNNTTGKFGEVDSKITYAPVNACDYDGGGGFRYDSDGDGSIDTDPSKAITNDLVPLLDADGDGVFDVFDEHGFVLPVPPPNLDEP